MPENNAPPSPLDAIRAQVLAMMSQLEAILATLDSLTAMRAAGAAAAAADASERLAVRTFDHPGGLPGFAPATGAASSVFHDPRPTAREVQLSADEAGDLRPVIHSNGG